MAETFNSFASGLFSIASIVALVIGAKWTHFLFVRARTHSRQARLELEQAASTKVSADSDLLKFVFRIINSGKVPITVWWVHSTLWELPTSIGAAYEEDGELFGAEDARAERNTNYGDQDWSLEPSEAEPFAVDFIVSNPKPAYRFGLKVYLGRSLSSDEKCLLGRRPPGDTERSKYRAIKDKLQTKGTTEYEERTKEIDKLLESGWSWETYRLVKLVEHELTLPGMPKS